MDTSEDGQAAIVRTIRESLIGENEGIPTCVGPRRITYCDHTASGRSLSFVEQHLADTVLPLYSNTHSTTSECGFQSHMFLNESRDLIRDAVNASEKDDVVLFAGRGATGAINTLVHHLLPPLDVADADAAANGGVKALAGRTFTDFDAGRPGASPAEPAFACAFPGCKRSFRSAVDLHMHARTHPDGEATAWRLHTPSAAPSAASAAATTVGTAGGAAATPDSGSGGAGAGVAPPTQRSSGRRYRAVVVVGPYAHHSSILPWQERGGCLLLHVATAGLDATSLHQQLRRAHRIAAAGGWEAPAAPAEPAFSTSAGLLASPPALPSGGLPVLIIGAFTAGSNVTGCMVNVDRVTAALHAYGALALWDYAAAAPHTGLDVNPKAQYSWVQLVGGVDAGRLGAAEGRGDVTESDAAADDNATSQIARDSISPAVSSTGPAFACALDAAYLSVHKFVGGPGSPGLLIMKRRLLRSAVPPCPGGGTVFFVHSDGTPRYLANDAEREEAGSPDLVAAARASMAFHVMRSVGLPAVAAREGAMATAARLEWDAHPRIRILGADPEGAASTAGTGAGAGAGAGGAATACGVPRLPIVSFAILSASTTPSAAGTSASGSSSSGAPAPRLLHWSFVTALLNDIFGIQSRGGCLCAGPYMQELLGISPAAAQALEGRLLGKEELLRPGVVRVSFPYVLSHATFRYILDAVAWVATHGEALLWLYSPLHESGEWRVNRSQAWSLLGEGRKMLATAAGTAAALLREIGGVASAAAAAAAAAGAAAGAAGEETGYGPESAALPAPTAAAASSFCPFEPAALLGAQGVIAAGTHAPGAEAQAHISEGHRGGIKTHPRRWLQHLKLRADGGITRPDYRILIRTREDDDAAGANSPPAGAGRAAAGEAAASDASKPTEAALLQAYLAEAWTLLLASHAKRPASTAALAHHHVTALLSEQGQGMRWFALATDTLALGAASSSPAAAAPPSPAGASAAAAEAAGSPLPIGAQLQCWRVPRLAAYLSSARGQPVGASGDRTAAAGSGATASDGDRSRFSSLQAGAWARPDPAWLRMALSPSLAVAGGHGATVEKSDADSKPAPLSDAASHVPASSAVSALQMWNGPSPAHANESAVASAAGRAATATVQYGSSGVSAAEGSASDAGAARGGKRVAAGGKQKPATPAAVGAAPAVPAAAVPAAAAAAPVEISARTAAAAADPSLFVASASDSAASRDATASAAADAASIADVAAAGAAAANDTPEERGRQREAAFRQRALDCAATSAALKRLLPEPPAKLYNTLRRDVMEAVVDFRMIQEGDRLLLGLSGGKDSLSLLILLLLMRERSPVRFEIGCCTVNPMYPGFDPSPLKAFLRDLGVPYHYISEPIIEMAGEHMTRDSICAWCSRMKRGILYTTARKHGYGVLVLGQHLDDCAESFVMSAFRNGLLRTMKAHYLNDEGDIRIIRPLVYSRERATREFADVMRLPIITDNCPACYTGPTERYHIKKLLGAEEASNPSLFSSLRRACRTLMTDGGARAVRHLQHQVDAELEEAAESRKRASVRGRAPAASAAAAAAGGGSGAAAGKGRRKARMGSAAAAAAAAAEGGGEDSDGEGAGAGGSGSAAMRAAAAEAAAVLRLLGQGPLSQPPTATAPTGARALAAAAEGTAALAAARAGAIASAAAAAAATTGGAVEAAAAAAAADHPHAFSAEEEDGEVAAAGADDAPHDDAFDSGSGAGAVGGGMARLIVTEEGGRMRLNFIPGPAKRPAAGAGSGAGAPSSCGLSSGCTLDDDDEDD